MKTWVSDNFPLDLIECQYMDICSNYIPDNCQYNYSCPIRNFFMEHIESYVARDCLHERIVEIIRERK